ncbi:phage tail sheath subtilisin-like domain-containing protein [Endozoicomonas acroporae]|uniref:phage tail sheath subtilisin-like domain-containing protein n=1 Tax=Endozoicomonas acroporae TaxID=1701104 RepID=UPI0013D07396|nr:phage tail sheath subtilisin-like domain-containing protein [Endozoicomonas acroporae]
MSQISFSLIPKNLRVPGAYAEFDNRHAVQGLVGQPYRVLIIGQMLSGSPMQPLTPVDITRAEEGALFGRGSMMAGMISAYKDNDSFTKLTAIGVLDDAAGNQADGTITLAGTANDAGTLNVYIGGRRVRVGVSANDTAANVATALVAAITADPDSIVTATASAGAVTIKARHKGEAGNEIDLRINYYTGEVTPSGLTVNIEAMSGGTANPDLSAVIAAMGDTWYNVIACPYTDAANLVQLEDELKSRFGPMRAIDGVAIAAKNANHAGLTTLGQSRNSPHLCICESYAYPRPSWERAAMMCAQTAYSAQNDPARPFQTLALVGDMPPAEATRFTLEERNLLLFDGIATHYTDAGGNVCIERLITTYTENSQGAPDPSYLDANTLFTLSYLRYTWRARVLQRFPRMKLGNDGARGDNVVTPKVMKGEMVALAGDWADAGLIEELEAFKQNLVVSRPADDVNRLDIILPPDLMNQLRITAARIDFRL